MHLRHGDVFQRIYGQGLWGGGSGSGSRDATTFDVQNRIKGMAGFTTPTYDNNGNMKKDEAGNTYTYDAWNRLVYSTVGSSVEYNTYDADNRRPGLSICSGAITNSYYSTSWQDVEDDVYNPCGGTTTVSTYVWGLSYIDDMVARDQSVNGGAATRIYAQQDANHDVTSITDASGNVLERFVYDPYGTATVLNATNWTNRSDGYSWVYRFQGGRYDPISGKINFRNRDLDTVTGTWMEKDPAGYLQGPNLYVLVDSDPASLTDAFGLCPVGKLRNPHCQIAVVPFGSTPKMEDAKQGLIEAAGSLENLELILDQLDWAEASEDFWKAFEVAAEKAIQKADGQLSGDKDAAELAQKAKDLIAKARGTFSGYEVYTRITYEKCHCQRFFGIKYWSSWDTKSSLWHQSETGGIDNKGTFSDEIAAYKAGKQACDDALDSWEEANKNKME